MTTLRQLHEELNITQRLSLYVKNQNKKYKPNEPFTADGELSKTMETLIRINTLGKLGRHTDQVKVMSKASVTEANVKLSKAISENTVLYNKLCTAEEKARRAEKIVNNANMRDYIIELYRASSLARELAPTTKSLPEDVEKTAKKYTGSAFEYLNYYTIAEILEKEAKKLIAYLKQKEGK